MLSNCNHKRIIAINGNTIPEISVTRLKVVKNTEPNNVKFLESSSIPVILFLDFSLSPLMTPWSDRFAPSGAEYIEEINRFSVKGYMGHL